MYPNPKGLSFTNRNSIFNHKFVYLTCMILKFLDITDMQNNQKVFQSKNKQHILYIHVRGVRFLPPMWVREH